MKNDQISIIAGPCSIDENNISEVYKIASIQVKNKHGKIQKAVAGTRVVGLKSRTDMNTKGAGMGIDYDIYMRNMKLLLNGGSLDDLETPPSVQYAKEVVEKTNMLIATEIMSPHLQIPQYKKHIPQGKLLLWNPSVNQLGWTVAETAYHTHDTGWHVGVKNGKWLDQKPSVSNDATYTGSTTFEKTWLGLTKYAQNTSGEVILIHRGVDIPEKGDYRNYPVHVIAQRVKKAAGTKLYFDPSHTYGPKMKDKIVPAVIKSMKMKIDSNEYLYDGILVEVGTSSTDTDQHISVKDLEHMLQELAQERHLKSPIEVHSNP